VLEHQPAQIGDPPACRKATPVDGIAVGGDWWMTTPARMSKSANPFLWTLQQAPGRSAVLPRRSAPNPSVQRMTCSWVCAEFWPETVSGQTHKSQPAADEQAERHDAGCRSQGSIALAVHPASWHQASHWPDPNLLPFMHWRARTWGTECLQARCKGRSGSQFCRRSQQARRFAATATTRPLPTDPGQINCRNRSSGCDVQPLSRLVDHK
jgi:hypothetical protein